MEKIIRLQLALFFTELESRPDRLMNSINEAMGNLFNGMPQVIQLPPGVPQEIPSVILKSEDDKYNCNISNTRIDLIFNGGPNWEVEWKSIIQDFLAKKTLFCNFISNEKKTYRFGFIGQFFIPDNKPAFQISRKYLKSDLGSLEELNIRYNKPKELYGLKLNDIYSINAAKEDVEGQLRDGIFIERDINNVPLDVELNNDDTKRIIDKLVESFYPDQIKGLIK
jgi:hypothetical protein